MEVFLRHVPRVRQHAHVRVGALLAEYGEPPKARCLFRASTVHVRSRVEELRAIKLRQSRRTVVAETRRQFLPAVLTISARGADNFADNFADKFADNFCRQFV